MIFDETIIGEEIKFQGKIFTVKKYLVELSDGSKSYREEVEHLGGACVIAYHKGYVYLVKQFRLSLNRQTLELPAGKLEKGESPLSCALREITEETGLKAENLTEVFVCAPSPGYTNEKIYIYFGDNFAESNQNLDEGEFLNVVKLTPKECFELVDKGVIQDGKTIIGLLWLKDRLARW